jgi:hypothetical protein
MGEERYVYGVLVGKTEGKRSIGRPTRRWEEAIRLDLRKIGWGCGMDSVGSGQGPVEASCEHGDEPSSSGATELVLKKYQNLSLSVAETIHVPTDQMPAWEDFFSLFNDAFSVTQTTLRRMKE